MIEQTFHTPLPVTLEVSIPSGAIAVETDGAEETAVTVDGDERMLEAVEVRHDGGRVVVSLQNRGRFGISLGSLFGNGGLRVEARVPHGATVRVKTASADTELAGHFGALELNSASGDVRLRGEIAEDATDGSRRKFAYPPSLLVIDGGPGQVDAAVRALSELGITDIAVCGLAKRLEEVWLPGEDSPVIMPRSSEGLYLLQRVRDEAHRSAITYHRAKRAAAQRASELDALPGLGPARKAALLKSFGSVKRLREATAEQIAEVDGFGPRLAEKVAQALHGTGGS